MIWTKILLKLEFPQSFYETMIWPTQFQGLQPKPSYLRGLTDAGVTQVEVQNLSSSLTPDQLMQESAVLLYSAVVQPRRGVSGFNPTEHVGPHAVGKVTLTWYASQPTFPVFVDTWGQPIGFIRWPLNGLTSDLNQPPLRIVNNPTLNLPIDPQDPERTLLDSDWKNGPRVQQFIALFGYTPTDPPLNLTPVIASAGRDKTWGIDALFGRLSADEDDNIYGYRLSGVGRNN